MSNTKPFPYSRYWQEFAAETQDWPPSPLAEKMLAALPATIGGAVVVEVGPGGCRDTLYVASHPKVCAVHTIDVVPTAAQVVQAVSAAMPANLSGGEDHLAALSATTKALEDISADEIPMANAILACGTLPYVAQQELLPVTEKLLSRLNVGGLFVANFAGLGAEPAERGMPPIACVTAEELKTLLANAGCDGDVIACGEDGKPTTSDRPVMFEVIAQKCPPSAACG